MTPIFHPQLINDPFDDPGLYVDFLFERRAILFDLGEVSAAPTRKLLRISHAFISHTHIDHFIGFDHLIRLFLGREKRLHLYGPPGFVAQVGHRLAAYTWNLVDSYPTDFTVVATELDPAGGATEAEFHCKEQFRRSGERRLAVAEGVLLAEEGLEVRGAFLDHKIPSIAYSLAEKRHVNVMKNRLDELGLRVGPWLQGLKRAVLRGEADDFPIVAQLAAGGEADFPLGELQRQVLHVVPGQKIAYVTDAAHTPQNAERIVALAEGADYLFIEATFLHREADRAAERCHLTARQAGELARRAGVARVVPFHFSPKYSGEEGLLLAELEEAFRP